MKRSIQEMESEMCVPLGVVTEKATCSGPCAALMPAHAAGDLVERLVPGDRLPAGIGGALGIGAAHGPGQAVGVIDELGRGAALGAELVAGRMARQRLDAREPAVLDHGDAAAARAALRAECGRAGVAGMRGCSGA